MNQSTYRQLISVLFRLIVLIGLLFVMVPFIATIFFDDKSLNSNTNNVLEVKLADLQVGQIKKIKLGYIPVWIYKRRDNEIIQLQQQSSLLADPIATTNTQVSFLHKPYRSQSARYFVFKPVESIRSCAIRYLEQSSSTALDSLFAEQKIIWLGGFTESCYGSIYDLAGRRYRGTGKDGQHSLAVPSYKILKNTTNNTRQQGDVILFNLNFNANFN